MQKQKDGGVSTPKGIGGDYTVPTLTVMDAKLESTELPRMQETTRSKLREQSNDAHTRKRGMTMKTYEFTIIASGLDETADDFESRFYDNGCDDATVSFQKGNILVDFAREANNLEEAISSALSDVRETGAKVERVEPDPLVSLSDIATRSGLTRAALHNYATQKRGEGFPPASARVTTSTPLWQWADVAAWLVSRGQLETSVQIDAKVFQTVNDNLSHDAGFPLMTV